MYAALRGKVDHFPLIWQTNAHRAEEGLDFVQLLDVLWSGYRNESFTSHYAPAYRNIRRHVVFAKVNETGRVLWL